VARIDYGAITQAIRDVIAGDPDVRKLDATVEIGAPVAVGFPFVGVYEGRRSLTAGQPLAAGTRTRYRVDWDVWVANFSGESFADAASGRNELLGYVEVALMANRGLLGSVGNNSLMLQGGVLEGGRAEGGFIAQASLGLTVEVEATTG